MINAFKNAPILFSVTTVLIVISLALLVTSFPLGLAISTVPGKIGYFEKTNWSLQPLFLPILALLLYFSWKLYRKAWSDLPSREILWKEEVVHTNYKATEGVILALEKLRPNLVFTAIVLGAIVTAIDAGCLWREYGVLDGLRIFDGLISQCSEPDFTIAFRLPSFPQINLAEKYINGWFVVVAYFMQGSLGAYAFLALFQLAFQSIYFLRFEKLSVNKENFSIGLNYNDDLRQFGLSDINRAINITYLFIALAMILPVLSAYNNPSADLGQWILRVLLPLILLVPTVIPIVDRITRLEEAEERMLNDPDSKASENFAQQRLWPFEGTKIGYVGKGAVALIIVEYGYLITKNIGVFLKFVATNGFQTNDFVV